MIRRFGHWLVALLACAAMIGLHAYTGEFGHVDARRATIGQTARLYASTVVVNGWSIGQVLYSDDAFVGRTGVIYLAVNVTVATDGSERSTSWKVGGESNGRTFAVDDSLDEASALGCETRRGKRGLFRRGAASFGVGKLGLVDGA